MGGFLPIRGLLAALIVGASMMAVPLSASATVGVESVGDVVTITLDNQASSILVEELPDSPGLVLNERSPTGPTFVTQNCVTDLNGTTEMICPGSFEVIYLSDDDQAGQRDAFDASTSPTPLGIPSGQTPDILDSPITLTGSAGPDVMTQASASAGDILNGGPGDDTIDVFDGEADTVDCGSGLDSAKADPIDHLVNCEYPLVVVDGDQDGVTTEEDCDDKDPAIFPGATDVPGNGVDEDCDGKDASPPVIDADRDGFSSSEDCDDHDAKIKPGATDVPGNGVDEDCSGADAAIVVPPVPDTDADGIPDPADCDDQDAKIKPGALEIVGNSVDENCDRVVAPFPLIGSSIHSSFQVSRGGTKMVALIVTDIPQGATIQLTCDIGHHGSSTSSNDCPFAKRSFGFGRGPRQSTDLSGSFSKRKLKPGVVITVTVSAPQVIGKQVQFKTRKGKKPAISSTCAPPLGNTGTFCGETDHF